MVNQNNGSEKKCSLGDFKKLSEKQKLQRSMEKEEKKKQNDLQTKKCVNNYNKNLINANIENSKQVQEYWQKFENLCKDNVHHQSIDLSENLYKDSKPANNYLAELLKKPNNQNLSEEDIIHEDKMFSTSSSDSDENCERDEHQQKDFSCSHTKQNLKTGDIYLINYILKMVNDKYQVYLQFYILDNFTQKFHRQSCYFIDQFQIQDFQNISLARVLSFNSNQYFFVKNNNDEQGKMCKRFELREFHFHEQSKYEFLESKERNFINQSQYKFDVNQQHLNIESKLSIDIPVNFEYNLEELDICFLQNVETNICLSLDFRKFISQQYVLIKTMSPHTDKTSSNKNSINLDTKSGILIYSLENNSKPIIQFSQIEALNIFIGFYKIIDQNITVFILQSHTKIYQIIYDKRNLPITGKASFEDDPRIQTEYIDDEEQNQRNIQNSIHKIPQVKKLKLLDSFEDSFEQFYYIDGEGSVRLIYPYHSHFQEKNDCNNHPNNDKVRSQKYREIKQIIKSESLMNQENSQLTIAYFDDQEVEIGPVDPQILKIFDQFSGKKMKNQCQYSRIFCFNDLIIFVSNQLVIDVFSFKNYNFQPSFQQIHQEIRGNDNTKFYLPKIIENFDWKNDKKRKINQKDIFNDHKSQTNKYIENFYIHKYKQNVMSCHNSVYVNDTKFDFPYNQLVLDLYQNDQKKSNFKVLNLYSGSTEDLKLIKYHCSNSCIIFFFIHRNNLNHQNKIVLNKLTGVHFFVIRKIQDVEILIQDQKPLIDNKQTIYISYKIDKFIKMQYDPIKILKFESKLKITSCTTNDYNFETVKDQADPTSSFVPFIFHSLEEKNEFQLYLCFLNIEAMSEKLQYQLQDSEDIKFKDQIQDSVEIKFKDQLQDSEEIKSEDQLQDSEDIKLEDYMQTFKINCYQQCQGHEETNQKTSYQFHNESCKSSTVNLFARSSDWQNGLFEIKKNLNLQNCFSAIFQIGMNFEFDHANLFEIQEFLVTIEIDTQQQNSIYNFIRNTSDSKIKRKSISIMHIQQKFLWKSQRYIQNQIQQGSDPYQNNRLIPIINDNGSIKGSYFLMNKIQNYKGIHRISSDLETVRKYSDPLSIEILMMNLGQYVLINSKKHHSFTGYLSNGRKVENMNYEILEEFKIDKQKKHELYFDKGVKPTNYLSIETHPEFVYDIFPIDEIKDKKLFQYSISSKITLQSIQLYAFENQKDNQLYMCSTKFTKDLILKRYFDQNESIYWLYFFSKFLQSMSIFNFKELQFQNDAKFLERYYQPRHIFKGKSFISFDQDENNENFNKKIRKSFNLYEKSNEICFIENSVIHLASQNTMKKKSKINEQMFMVCDCLGIDKFHGLQYNYLECESVIQNALTKGELKTVSVMVEIILNYSEESQMSYLMSQDMPQLLQSKAQINDYLNVTYFEKYLVENRNFGEKVLKQMNNLEQIFEEDRLIPKDEKNDNQVYHFEKFDGPYSSIDQLKKFIQIKYKEKTQNQQNKLVHVRYSFINFSVMIKKMKLDKIIERNECKEQGTYYLKHFKDPYEINQIDDLFLSYLIKESSEEVSLMNQSTIKRIIDSQFEYTKRTIKQMLIIYIAFFVLPFMYTIYEVNLYHDDKGHLENVNFRYICYIISMVTQIFFCVLEYAEIKQVKFKEYLMDYWNVIDVSQVLSYTAHIILQLYCQIMVHDYIKLLDNFLQILLVFQASLKIMEYIRYDQNYSSLVQMIIEVSYQLLPFISIFIMYVFLFTMISIIMEVDYKDEDYKNLPEFARIFIQTLRNSLGDISAMEISFWKTQEKESQNDFTLTIALIIAWMFWLINVLGMMVVLTNFLISQVNQTYAKVSEKKDMLLYQQKAHLNNHVLQIHSMFSMFYPQKPFQVLILQESKAQNDSLIQDYKSQENTFLLQKSLEDLKQSLKKNQNLKKQGNEYNDQLLLNKMNQIQNEVNTKFDIIDDKFKNLKDSIQIKSVEKEKKIYFKAKRQDILNKTLNIRGRQKIKIFDIEKSTDDKNEPYQDHQTTNNVSSLNLQASLKGPIHENSFSNQSNNLNISSNPAKNHAKFPFLQINKIKFQQKLQRGVQNENLQDLVSPLSLDNKTDQSQMNLHLRQLTPQLLKTKKIDMIGKGFQKNYNYQQRHANILSYNVEQTLQQQKKIKEFQNQIYILRQLKEEEENQVKLLKQERIYEEKTLINMKMAKLEEHQMLQKNQFYFQQQTEKQIEMQQQNNEQTKQFLQEILRAQKNQVENNSYEGKSNSMAQIEKQDEIEIKEQKEIIQEKDEILLIKKNSSLKEEQDQKIAGIIALHEIQKIDLTVERSQNNINSFQELFKQNEQVNPKTSNQKNYQEKEDFFFLQDELRQQQTKQISKVNKQQNLQNKKSVQNNSHNKSHACIEETKNQLQSQNDDKQLNESFKESQSLINLDQQNPESKQVSYNLIKESKLKQKNDKLLKNAQHIEIVKKNVGEKILDKKNFEIENDDLKIKKMLKNQSINQINDISFSDQKLKIKVIFQDSSRKQSEEWMNWSYKECESKLLVDNKDLYANFRLCQIYILENKNLKQAQKIIQKIQILDKNFLQSETYELLGDIEIQKESKNFKTAAEFYKKSIEANSNRIQIYIKLGKMYEIMKNYEQSIQVFKNALSIDQNSFICHYRLGCLFLKNNMRDEAAEALLKANRIDSKDIETLLKLSEIYLKNDKKIDLALSFANNAIKVSSENPGAHIILGKIYEKKGMDKEAIRSFELAIKQSQDQSKINFQAHYQFGCFYQDKKKNKLAINHYKQCLLIDQTNIEASLRLAKNFIIINETQKAEKYFEHCIKLNPQCADAFYGLGEILYEQGDRKNSLNQLMKGIESDPQHCKSLWKIGVISLELGNPEDSAFYLKKCLQINQNFIPGIVSMGTLLFETGYSENALKYYQQALNLDPENLQAITGAGNAFQDLKDYQQAVQFYIKAIGINSEIPDLYYNLGNSQIQIGKIDEAILSFEKTLSLNPKKTEANYNIGNLLCRKKEYKQAMVYYKNAISQDPDHEPAFFNLGFAYYKTGELQKAIDTYKICLQLNQKNSECQFNLGLAYEEIDDTENAIKHFTHVSNLDSKNVQSLIRLAVIYENKEKWKDSYQYYKKAFDIDPQLKQVGEGMQKIKEKMVEIYLKQQQE